MGAGCPKLSQRSHGAWQIRQELAPTPEGQRRTFRRLGYPTQTAAQADLDKVRALLALGEDEDDAEAVSAMLDALSKDDALPDVDTIRRKLRTGQALAKGMTVSEWLDRWTSQEAGTHRKATDISYESHIRLYLKPKVGDVRIDRLTVGQVKEMFNKICDDNDAIEANNADRRSLLSQAKQARSRAEKRRLRAAAAELPPFRRTAGPSSRRRIQATLRGRAQRRDHRAVDHVQPGRARQHPCEDAQGTPVDRGTGGRVAAHRSAARSCDGVDPGADRRVSRLRCRARPGVRGVVARGRDRGPRRGELAGLGWTEVDLDAESVQINTQLTEVAYEVAEGAPKSEAGERTIPLDAEAVRLLQVHRARQNEARLRLGPAWVGSGRVWTRPDGAALRPSWLSDRFAALVAAAGLPPIRFHDLRHVAATTMLAAKVDLKVIQETLGHERLQTTSDLYTSVLPELARDAAEATVALIPRAPRQTLGHPSGTQGNPQARASGDSDVHR
ncbi:site-specific integrase [Actinokineospora iranica]|uniref:Phage integrase family protein n=1 Tax=Actinokineospora iranica TaxID=1271860 RepID=A0A1G6NZV6_9PSEU|nr:site-specific integrase [Actinokineospora iranica]SDC73482.1 Phage integrase family protein [Actinokineospora iranica]